MPRITRSVTRVVIPKSTLVLSQRREYSDCEIMILCLLFICLYVVRSTSICDTSFLLRPIPSRSGKTSHRSESSIVNSLWTPFAPSLGTPRDRPSPSLPSGWVLSSASRDSLLTRTTQVPSPPPYTALVTLTPLPPSLQSQSPSGLAPGTS